MDRQMLRACIARTSAKMLFYKTLERAIYWENLLTALSGKFMSLWIHLASDLVFIKCMGFVYLNWLKQKQDHQTDIN